MAILFAMVLLAASAVYAADGEHEFAGQDISGTLVGYGPDYSLYNNEASPVADDENDLDSSQGYGFGGLMVAPLIVPANAEQITVNFPGIEDVRVSFWVGGGWHHSEERFDNSATVVVPAHTGTIVVQVAKGAMSYNFNDVTVYDGMAALNVPITTVTVSGVSSAANIGISQGDWVYRQAPAVVGSPNVFNVFDNGRPYIVAVGRAGFHNVTFDGIQAGSGINISPLFYNIEIPSGVSGVRIADATWVNTAVWQSVWTTEGQRPYHVDVITLFNNGRPAVLHFTYDGNEHIFNFVLDGTNPFNNLPVFGLQPVEGEFGLFAFNNGNSDNASLAQGGNIRVWTQINGVNTRVTYPNLEVTAIDQNGSDAMEFVSVNRIWNDTDFVNLIDVRKREANGGAIMPWHWIDLTAVYNNQPVTIRLFNNYRDFGYRIFNNGTGGTPSTPNADLAANGRVRTWLHIDSVSALIPYDSLAVSATDQNGADAMDFIIINQPWAYPGFVNFIDANKNAPWQRIYLNVTHMDQTLELILINSRFFTVDVFNNGPGPDATPSTVRNDSLQSIGAIRIWTNLGGERARVPYAELTIEAIDQDGNNVGHFVNVNRIWNDLDNFQNIDVTKWAAWQRMELTVTVYGQSHTLILYNDLFFSVNVFNNGPGPDATPSTVRNDSLQSIGAIRIWAYIGGVNLAPYAELELEAVDQDGNDVSHLVNVNRIWNDTDNFRNIDVTKWASWRRMELTVTMYNQSRTLILYNDLFFTLNVFNNGNNEIPTLSTADFGRVRMWTQLAGVGTDVNVTAMSAYDQDGNCVLDEFIMVSRAGGLVRSIDANKHARWQWIDFSITAYGQTIDVRLLNNRFFGAHVVNNGNGVNFNQSLQNSGLIRIWMQLLNVETMNLQSNLVHYAGMNVTALDQDGNNAMMFVNVNRIWNNMDFVNLIDVDKNGGWIWMDLTMVVYGQSITVRLYNDLFPGWFGLNIFNNGQEGSPSRSNASLEQGGIIRMWTQLDGENAEIPLAGVKLDVTAVVPSGIDAMQFINVPNVGGSGYANRVDVSKNAQWEFIYLTVTFMGQTIEVVLHNANYGQGADEVTVIFDAGNGTGTMNDVPVSVGGSFILPANGFTAPAGYEFYGWFVTGYAAPDGSMAVGDIITVSVWPNTTVTVTAVWISITLGEHTVSFAPGDGSGTMAAVQAESGDSFALPVSTFTAPVSYEFFGWFVTGYANTLGTLLAGDSIIVNGTVTATALWVAIIPGEHTVSFAPGDGSGTMAAVQVESGDSFALPVSTFTAPVGYEFFGWFVTGYANTLGTLLAGDSIIINGSVTATALWVAITPGEHTVSFAPGDGSGTMAAVQAESGDSFALPVSTFTAPVGYEFFGWFVTGYANTLGTLLAGDSIVVNGSVTATALWVAIASQPGQPCDCCNEYPCACDLRELAIVIYSATLLGDGSVRLVINIEGACNLDGHQLRVTSLDEGVEFFNAAATQDIYISSAVSTVSISLMCPDSIEVLMYTTWNRPVL